MDAKLIKKLILSGQITTFSDLTQYVSVKELAKAMGCSVKHVNYLLVRPDKVLLKDVANLAEAIGLKGWEKVAELFIRD